MTRRRGVALPKAGNFIYAWEVADDQDQCFTYDDASEVLLAGSALVDVLPKRGKG